MNVVLFYHSLLSDWNHGNAHFLRGILSELRARGHDAVVYEPADSWSFQNLVQEHGEEPVRNFRAAYPGLRSVRYHPAELNLSEVLAEADLVIVHEWNSPALVREIGQHHAAGARYTLLFHDTHHRVATDRAGMAAYDLRHYDGVLAYGRVLRDLYVSELGVPHAWTWHEAADSRVFYPRPRVEPQGDVVWIGNWGDDERTEELHEYLIEPVRALGLKCRVYGVRYPEAARRALADAGIEYAGWLPNYEAPAVFAQFRATLHIPRRPYTRALPGIPTIRVFEALACGIPLICSPWPDCENLFRPGTDYLIARNGAEMREQLARVLNDPALHQSLVAHGLETIRQRHTCRHRVDELLALLPQLNAAALQT
jgi:spore maturation protein CgeB